MSERMTDEQQNGCDLHASFVSTCLYCKSKSTKPKLAGTVKIYGTKLYSGCGHEAVKGFDECPLCRIRELEAENQALRESDMAWQNDYIDAQKRISKLKAENTILQQYKKERFKLRRKHAALLEKLEAKISAMEYLIGDRWVTPNWMVKRIRELEAKLDAVEALPQNWRDISYKTTDSYTNLHGCADELEAIIKEVEDE